MTSGFKTQQDVCTDTAQGDLDKRLMCSFWMPKNLGSKPAEVATGEASSVLSRIAKDDSRRRRATTGTKAGGPPLVVLVMTFCTVLPRGPGHGGALRCRPGWLEHPFPGFTLVEKRRLAPDGKSPPAIDDVSPARQGARPTAQVPRPCREAGWRART